MHVGIDISSLIYQRGVSRYTANLVRALLHSNDLQLSLYGSSYRQKKELLRLAKNLFNPVKTEEIITRSQKNIFLRSIYLQSWPPTILTWLWSLGLNQIKKIMPNIDVFHSWDWLQPPDKKLPLVSTIHDLAILKYPDIAHPKILNAHQRSWKILKEKQAQIIAVSQATKKDIINYLNIPSYFITVIPEALPSEIIIASESLTEEKYQQIKNQLNLNQPYLLFVGTPEPRKNLARLIQAWSKLAQNYQLIIAGKNIKDQNQQTPQLANLRFLGQVSDQELVVLYSEAVMLVYPSLDEGFGLPILEAFYHGTPVLTSYIPATIEVAGNAATYVDAENIESIYQGIINILNENADDQKKRLQRMIIRLQMFSWQRVAEETIKVYQKAIYNQ